MKKILLFIAATALLAGVFTSCKKDEEVAPEEVKYKVTFNALDGKFSNGKSTKDTTVLSGSKVTKPSETPTLAGSVFDNWYADSALTKVYDFNTAVTKDLTIYAKYISTEKSMTLEEQAKYLNETGLALLGQIDTLDFKKLAQGIKDLTGFHYDVDSTWDDVVDHYDTVFYDKNKHNWYIDPDEFALKVVIDPTKKDDNTSFSTDCEKGTSVAGFTSKGSLAHLYKAEAKFTASEKLLLAGRYKDAKKDSLIWVYAPQTLALDVYVDGNAYVGLNLNLNCDNMPDSVANYILKHFQAKTLWEKVEALLPLFQFAIGGDIYVNGTSSYKIHLENISADIKTGDADIDLTIYGKEGTPILSGKVSANANEVLRLIKAGKTTLTPSEIRDVAMATLKSFGLNVLDGGARLVWNDDNNKLIELYLGEATNHQIWFDPRDVSLASGNWKDILNTKFIYTADPKNPVVSINDLANYSQYFSDLMKEATKLANGFKNMFSRGL